MFLRAWWLITLLIAGLGMTMGAAHTLELLPKMQYDAQLYSAVNTTLYRYFAIVGGALTVGGILAAGVLAYLVRGRDSFSCTLAGAVCLALSFGLWLALVAPVNGAVAHTLQVAPQAVPGLWMRLRPRWEYGHVAAFAAWLLGYALLVSAALREMPAGAAAHHETDQPPSGAARATRPRAPA